MINFKNLSKAIKHTRIPVFWFRTEEHSYLFTGYFGIRTTRKLHIEKGIFATLINLFQDIPEVSKGIELKNNFTGVAPMKEQQIKTFIELIEKTPTNQLAYTELVSKQNFREDIILKAPDNYIFLDRIFMDIVEVASETKLYGSGPNNAVYASNGEEIVMILPVRYESVPEHLKTIGGR